MAKLFFEKDHLTFSFMFLFILRTYLSVFRQLRLVSIN